MFSVRLIPIIPEPGESRLGTSVEDFETFQEADVYKDGLLDEEGYVLRIFDTSQEKFVEWTGDPIHLDAYKLCGSQPVAPLVKELSPSAGIAVARQVLGEAMQGIVNPKLASQISSLQARVAKKEHQIKLLKMRIEYLEARAAGPKS